MRRYARHTPRAICTVALACLVMAPAFVVIHANPASAQDQYPDDPWSAGLLDLDIEGAGTLGNGVA